MKIAAPPAESSTAMAARYEALRAAAFGDGLPPEARSGLTLFLRRGMWGWARALTVTPRVSRADVSIIGALVAYA